MTVEPPPPSGAERMAAWLDSRVNGLEEDMKRMEGELGALQNARAVLRQLSQAADESMAAWRERVGE